MFRRTLSHENDFSLSDWKLRQIQQNNCLFVSNSFRCKHKKTFRLNKVHTHKKLFLWNRHFFICCLFIVFRKIRKIRHFLRSHSHRTHLFWLCPKEKPRKTLVISIIIATFICGCRLQPQIYQQFSFRVIILLLRITIELENLLQCQNGKRESSSSSWLNLWHRFSLYAHWPGVSPL